MCAQCGSENVTATPYTNEERESGYFDQGYLYTCRDCGAINTEEEMEKANAQED